MPAANKPAVTEPAENAEDKESSAAPSQSGDDPTLVIVIASVLGLAALASLAVVARKGGCGNRPSPKVEPTSQPQELALVADVADEKVPAPHALQPIKGALNAPGRWSFFISHTQRNGAAITLAEIRQHPPLDGA